MKRKKEDEQLSENSDELLNPHQMETDALIIEQLNMRKEENQALKKLLDNLNLTLPKSKA